MKQLKEKSLLSAMDVGKSQTRKKLKPGSLNIPTQNFQTVSIPRATPKKVTKENDNTTYQYYKSLKEIRKKLKLQLDWMVNVSEDVVALSKHADLFTVPKF